jgi:uncharacterized repeat protein (TIGR03803 family)
MAKQPQHRTWISWIFPRTANATLTLAINLTLLALATPSLLGQTFTVLYSFTGNNDTGANPYAALIRDQAGNLYGTTLRSSSTIANGTVFKLDAAGAPTILHIFGSRGDGTKPYAGLLRDNWGNLYGMTPYGEGRKAANGVVYRIDTTGKETLLHRFTGGNDGGNPRGGLIRDDAGNLYGGTRLGGTHGCGVVFKIKNSVGTVLYSFTGSEVNNDGCSLAGDLVRDEVSGNLYGTTSFGGNLPSCGTVFKLDTGGNETILHAFNCSGATDGSEPQAGLILDSVGYLYGTTMNSSPTGAGTVFKIDTAGSSYSILYTFSGGADGGTPLGPVIVDNAGNLYGTTRYGGNLSCNAPLGCGVVFKLDSKGSETVLHAFSFGADGALPSGGLARDGVGNLYGTAPRGGSTACPSGCGVVFKITP